MRATSKLLCYYQITSELTDEDEGDKNEVNTGEISENDVPGYLEVRTTYSFQTEQRFSISTTKKRNKLKNINHLG
ncbi:hypothetical protein TNCV_4543151 [Trichonephila clavipes]|nr:hypothetical protein TNCV_4543151 [Trichonephila clavipes]